MLFQAKALGRWAELGVRAPVPTSHRNLAHGPSFCSIYSASLCTRSLAWVILFIFTPTYEWCVLFLVPFLSSLSVFFTIFIFLCFVLAAPSTKMYLLKEAKIGFAQGCIPRYWNMQDSRRCGKFYIRMKTILLQSLKEWKVMPKLMVNKMSTCWFICRCPPKPQAIIGRTLKVTGL